MKRIFLFVLMALTTCEAAQADDVTFQTSRPDSNGGLTVDVGVDLNFNESRSVRWNADDNLRLGLAQNFHLDSDIVMDKYAVQLRADPAVSDQVVQLPNGDTPITVSLWELPNLTNSTYAYPAASASVGGVPKATWTLTVPDSARSFRPTGAHAGDWLIFDTPNIALTAGVQYGIQLGWPTLGPSGEKILIWVSNPDIYPDGYPVDLMAIANNGDPSVNDSYDPGLSSGLGGRTYRTQNFVIMALAGTPGDYNGNGIVDAADYVVWRKGGPLQNEVDTPGTVNAQDYTEWRSRFGNPSGIGSASSLAAVPEPGTMLLVGAAIGLSGCFRKRRLFKNQQFRGSKPLQRESDGHS